jgi:hypothetical protein
LPDGTTLLVGHDETDLFGFISTEARLYTVHSNGGVTTVPLNPISSLSNSSARGISKNGEYIVGYSSLFELFAEGTVWRRAAPQAPIGTGTMTHPEIMDTSSRMFAVSNDFTAVGVAGGIIPVRWTETTGLQTLAGHTPPGESLGGAADITPDGSVIVGMVATGETGIPLRPAVWTSADAHQTVVLLESAPVQKGEALAISPGGEWIGGAIDTLGALWRAGQPIPVLDSSGVPFRASIRGVTDDGLAFGYSHPDDQGQLSGASRGVVWHPTFNGVRTLEEWLSTEYSLSLPRRDFAVTDVMVEAGYAHLAVTAADGGFYVRVPLDNCGATAGDVNCDGQVDRTDVAVLVQNFGAGPGASRDQGDVNGDFAVSLADGFIIQSHLDPASAGIAAHVVPEPRVSALLGGFAAVLVLLKTAIGRRRAFAK